MKLSTFMGILAYAERGVRLAELRKLENNPRATYADLDEFFPIREGITELRAGLDAEGVTGFAIRFDPEEEPITVAPTPDAMPLGLINLLNQDKRFDVT